MNCYWFSIIVRRPSLLFNGIIIIIQIIIIIFTRSFKPVLAAAAGFTIQFQFRSLLSHCQFSWGEARYSKNEMMENGKLCGIFVVLHFPSAPPSVLCLSSQRKLHSASCKCQRGNAVRGGGRVGNVNWYTHRHTKWRWYCMLYIYIELYICPCLFQLTSQATFIGSLHSLNPRIIG